jgi:CRP-like cAMP-binding protein
MAAATLSDDEAAWLFEFFSTPGPGRELRPVRKGAVLFKKGAEVKEIFFIMRGEFKMNAISPQGKLRREIYGPQDWLEWGSLTADLRAHSDTAVAAVDSEVVAFPLTTFRKLREDHPPLNDLFVIGMARHIATINDVAADRRLARELLKWFDGKDVDVLAIEISPTRLAELISVTRQTVHTHINRFRASGLVTKTGVDAYLLHKEPLQQFLANGKHRR